MRAIRQGIAGRMGRVIRTAQNKTARPMDAPFVVKITYAIEGYSRCMMHQNNWRINFNVYPIYCR